MHLPISKLLLGFHLVITVTYIIGFAVAHEAAGKDFAGVDLSESTSDSTALNIDKNAVQKLGKSDADLQTIIGTVLNASGAPEVGAKVNIQARYAEVDVSTITDIKGSFQFQVRIIQSDLPNLKIWARSEDGSRLGYYRFVQTQNKPQLDSIEIRIEQTKTASVKVIDKNGVPIADSSVAIQLAYPNTIGPVQSDANGLAAIELPKSESIQTVVAWKDGIGLDYRLYPLSSDQREDDSLERPLFPFEEAETLTLEGASPLVAHVSDSMGQPLEGIETHVWLLGKNNRNNELNLSFFAEHLGAHSARDGTVKFKWFPKWQTGPTTIWSAAKGFVNTRGEYDPQTQTGTIEIQLERLIPIRGKVSFQDGKPAANIPIAASGAGYSIDGFHGVTKTDEHGRYELKVNPYQVYMLYVAGEKWSAPSQSGFSVLPNRKVEEHDFVLRNATRIHGRVHNKVNQEPVSGKLIYLTHHGIDLGFKAEDLLPNPQKSNRLVRPMRQENAISGNDGEFEFYVGDGNYNLFVRGMNEEKISIQGEIEKHVDLKIEVIEKILFSGIVVDDKSGQTMGGARIEAVSRNFRTFHDWKAISNNEGRFEVQRFAEPTYLCVISADGSMGAITEIKSHDIEVVMRLSRLGTVKGRLLTEDGLEPAARVKLRYGANLHDEKNQFSTNRFGTQVTTDLNGEFTLSGLVAGFEYECALADFRGGVVQVVFKTTVSAGQSKEIGEVKKPAPLKARGEP